MNERCVYVRCQFYTEHWIAANSYFRSSLEHSYMHTWKCLSRRVKNICGSDVSLLWVQNLYFRYISFILYLGIIHAHLYRIVLYTSCLLAWYTYKRFSCEFEVLLSAYAFKWALQLHFRNIRQELRNCRRFRDSQTNGFCIQNICDSLVLFFCLCILLFALSFSLSFFSSLFHFCFVHWNSTCFAITTQILAYAIAIHLRCRTFDKSAMNGTIPICDTHKNSFSGIYISFVANESNFNYKKVLCFFFFSKREKFFHSKIHDSRLFIRIILYFAIGD